MYSAARGIEVAQFHREIIIQHSQVFQEARGVAYIRAGMLSTCHFCILCLHFIIGYALLYTSGDSRLTIYKMKKLQRATVRAIFADAVDGGNSNAFRYVLPPLRSYAEMAKRTGNGDVIALSDMVAVLEVLSRKWEREITKETGI